MFTPETSTPEMCTPEKPTPGWTRRAPEYAIAVRGLGKQFGRRLAIDDLTLSVRPGEICGLTGANGGGKSTSLRLLAGLVAPDRGEGIVLGRDLVRAARRIRHEVGYLAQRNTLYSTLSVRENLRFRAAVFGSPDPARAADLQIGAFDLTEFATVSIGRLSGGWARQVELAAVLIHHPRVLLLDEPTAGLDQSARRPIWGKLTSLAMRGTAIVLSTHDSAEAERCAHILLLSDGRVRASGPPNDVISQVEASAL
jgi:ABC-2 type transport system ATP-binding protein